MDPHEYRFILEPYACQACGVPRGGHGQQWCVLLGVHGWAPPTQEQIKARMWLRRADWSDVRWLPTDGRTGYRKWKT